MWSLSLFPPAWPMGLGWMGPVMALRMEEAVMLLGCEKEEGRGPWSSLL